MQWSSLPLEVRLYVLNCLDLRELLCLRRVCKQLCSIIDTETNLQSTITLGTSGVISNPYSSLLPAQKLELLKIADTAWTNLHWTRRIDVPSILIKEVVGLSDGILFYTKYDDTTESESESSDGYNSDDTSPTKLSYIRLPSRRDLKPMHGPTLNLNFTVKSFAFDAARDLMILAEMCYNRIEKVSNKHSVMINLHILSITTNMEHPDSHQAQISQFFHVYCTGYGLNIKICGNHVGVLLSKPEADGADKFYILDWTTGTRKAMMHSKDTGEVWQSFCFLAADAILLPDSLKGALNVYFFDANPDSIKHAAALILPQTKRQPGLGSMKVASEPPPAAFTDARSSLVDPPPFVADPESTLVVVKLIYHNPREGIWGAPQVITQFVVLSRRTLLTLGRNVIKLIQRESQVETPGSPLKKYDLKQRVCFPAEGGWVYHSQWGLDFPFCHHSFFVHGTRLLNITTDIFDPLGSEHGPPGPISASIFDFNMFNERRGIKFLEENVRPIPDVPDSEWNEDMDWDWDSDTGKMRWPVLQSRVFKNRPNIVDLPEVFCKPFFTALSYRSVRTERILDWNFALIDGERIIGFSDSDDNHRDIDVIVL